MHACLVVDLDACILVPYGYVSLVADGQSLQEGWYAQVGVEILGLPAEGHRVDIAELVAHEEYVLTVVGESF